MMHLWKSNLVLNYKYSGWPEIKFKCLQAVWHLLQFICRKIRKAILEHVRHKYDRNFYMHVDSLLTIRQCNPVQL
jgi:hypothetical protein